MIDYTSPIFKSSALITIDTQVDTLNGQPLEIPGMSTILPAMIGLLKVFREEKKPIIHIVRLYQPDGSNVDVCRRALVESGTHVLAPGKPGSELAPGLYPDDGARLDPELLLSGKIQKIGPQEVIIYKSRWGAFFKTPLESHLNSLNISTLVFTGCNFPNCPRTSIYEASERDFRLILVKDAISGLYERGAMEMANIGVHLMTAAEVETCINRA